MLMQVGENTVRTIADAINVADATVVANVNMKEDTEKEEMRPAVVD